MPSRLFLGRKHPRLPIRSKILPVLLLCALIPGLFIHLTTPTKNGRKAVAAVCQNLPHAQCLELRFDTKEEIASVLRRHKATRFDDKEYLNFFEKNIFDDILKPSDELIEYWQIKDYYPLARPPLTRFFVAQETQTGQLYIIPLY